MVTIPRDLGIGSLDQGKAESELPNQFTHSLKIEDTAKGIRVSVHVYANSLEEANEQAFKLYTLAHDTAEKLEIPLAPVEVNKK